MAIENIINEIINHLESGPILPGGIRSYLNICGAKRCRCKDKTNPKKHGPYHKLSYAIAGNDSSMFIKDKYFSEAEKMVDRFKALKHCVNTLALEYVQLLRENGFDSSSLLNLEKLKSLRDDTINIIDESWKNKAQDRQNNILKYKTKIRDIEKSRKEWKQKASERKAEIEYLKKEMLETQKDELKKKTKKKKPMR